MINVKLRSDSTRSRPDAELIALGKKNSANTNGLYFVIDAKFY
jgi:hypothetical protein